MAYFLHAKLIVAVL